MDAVAVCANLAHEKARRLHCARRCIHGSGLHVWLAKRKAQFWQMGDLFDLSAGRLEENRRANSAMDTSERPFSVGVQRFRMRRVARYIRVDGDIEPLFAQLPKHHGAKFRNVQRRRSERDQRFGSGFPKVLSRRPRYPLCEHGEGASCLLELRQCTPLAPKYR